MTESAPKESPLIEEQSSAIVLDKIRRYYYSGGGLKQGTKPIVALDRVNLDIPRGRIFGLVGESGSGKSTIARLIVRLESPNAGKIRIGGDDIAHLRGKRLRQFRHRVQMIFQDPYQSLNPYQSVQSIVGEPLRIHGECKTSERKDKIVEALKMVGLHPPEAFLYSYPHQLSGGQRQRVAIARAMILNPDILVADEPTSMLDASISIQIYQLLSGIQQRRNVTMVFITHSLAAAHYLCSDIAVLYRGYIVETGNAHTVIAEPRHPYTQALMDALPQFGHVNRERSYNTLRDQELSGDFSGGCPFYSRCLKADPQRCTTAFPNLGPEDEEHRTACFFA